MQYTLFDSASTNQKDLILLVLFSFSSQYLLRLFFQRPHKFQLALIWYVVDKIGIVLERIGYEKIGVESKFTMSPVCFDISYIYP